VYESKTPMLVEVSVVLMFGIPSCSVIGKTGLFHQLSWAIGFDERNDSDSRHRTGESIAVIVR
jgi:hypothetical protein